MARPMAVGALGSMDDGGAAATLIVFLKDPLPLVRVTAAEGLGEIGKGTERCNYTDHLCNAKATMSVSRSSIESTSQEGCLANSFCTSRFEFE